MRLLIGRDLPAAPAAAGRRGMGLGVNLFLIAVGAVLLFAVPGQPWPSLNLHVVGLIVLILGVVRLLLALRAPGNGLRLAGGGGLRRFINPSGVDDPSVHDDNTAAEIDAERLNENDRFFSPPRAGRQHDER